MRASRPRTSAIGQTAKPPASINVGQRRPLLPAVRCGGDGGIYMTTELNQMNPNLAPRRRRSRRRPVRPAEVRGRRRLPPRAEEAGGRLLRADRPAAARLPADVLQDRHAAGGVRRRLPLAAAAGVHAWWLVLPLAVLLGLAMAAIGFNVQHDGGHDAYSEHKWVNKLMAGTLDLLGGSSYVWDWKHNSIHHTYTNITGHDDDIDLGFLGRLSPHQKRYPFHRLQGLYLWLLYGFIVIKWHFFDDFYFLATGRLGGHGTPRPRGRDLLVFVGGKVVFFSLAFVLPIAAAPAVGGAGGLRRRGLRQRRGPERGVPARPLRRGGASSRCRCRRRRGRGWRPTGRSTRCRRRWTSPAATGCSRWLLGGLELPGRAPPVPQDLPRPLPRPVEGGRGGVPRVRRPLRRQPSPSSARSARTSAGWSAWAGPTPGPARSEGPAGRRAGPLSQSLLTTPEAVWPTP